MMKPRVFVGDVEMFELVEFVNLLLAKGGYEAAGGEELRRFVRQRGFETAKLFGRLFAPRDEVVAIAQAWAGGGRR